MKQFIQFIRFMLLAVIIIQPFQWVNASIINSYLRTSNTYKLAEIDNAQPNSTLFDNIKAGCDNVYNKIGLGYIETVGASTCYQGGGYSVASFALDDLYFSRLPSYESLPDNFRVRVHLTYLADTFDVSDDNANLRLYTNIGSDFDFNNTINGSLIFGNTSVWETKSFAVSVGNAYGFKINSELTFPVYNDIRGPGQHFGSGSAKVRLGGSPVFVLPEGYTANSVSGNIVNNWYTGFDPFATNQVSVPEPTTKILLLMALGFLVLNKRKLKRE